MKKEDMMKLFKEENAGSGTGPGRFKLFILVIFIHSVNYSQIPINGFCKYSNFKVEPGNSSLFQVNYNNDFYSDMLLFSNNSKDVIMLQGDINGTFTGQKKYSLPFELTNVENLIDRDNRVAGYVFTSRKNLTAGLIKFDNSGRPVIDKQIKLNSYPDFISAGDYNRDGSVDFMISGSAFEGLSVISREGDKLTENKIVLSGSYSVAYFSDISNDGYPDIAGLNLITNSIDLFYNNGSGGFYKARSLSFESRIRGFRVYDIDLDGYDDIIIIQEKSIKIFYGDFSSSFEKDLITETDHQAESLLTADFNKDGYIDIAYLDKREGIVSILYASNERSFYKEIIYIKKKGIEKIIPFYSRFINGIAALSSVGEMYTITNLSSISASVNISAGVEPSVIRYFDFNNNGITDFAYLDEYDQKLKIVTRNKEGIPSLYFSYPLFDRYKDLIIEDISAVYKRFYCFSPGKKLIEIIDADLENARFRRSSLYSPGNILDVKTEQDENKSSLIYIAMNIDGKLGVSKVEQKELKYVFSTTLGITSDIKEASFGKEASSYLYYWSYRNSTLNLSRISYNRLFDDIRNLGSVKIKDNCKIAGITGNLLNNAGDHNITFISCNDENFTISASDSLFFSFNNYKAGEQGTAERERLFYGEIRFNGLKRLLFYAPASGKIHLAGILNNGRNITSTELADAPGVKSFFVKNMSFRKYHLVYTNSIENCITIIQL